MFKKFMQFFLGEPEGYISEADKFMAQNRQKLSASQQQEIANYKKIAEQRDENI